jgi:hypothetical protein
VTSDRFACLEAATHDKRLTRGASAVYVELHLRSKVYGECCATQAELADTLRLTERGVRWCLAQLVKYRHIVIDRTVRPQRYELPWFSSDSPKRPPASAEEINRQYTDGYSPAVEEINRQYTSTLPAVHCRLTSRIHYKVLKERSNRIESTFFLCTCGKPSPEGISNCGCCDPHPVEIKDPIDYVRRAISTHLKAWNLDHTPPFTTEPDDGICTQILEAKAVNGDLGKFWAILRAINGSAQRPTTYGWFPRVFATPFLGVVKARARGA